ncbi:MAG: 23S rRNA pseudouridine2457 synthase [Halieaceae bacterium]|jgi:23S rRNA pseudouridine2457 synthase
MARLILLNKPFQVLSQFTDPQGRGTLGAYISDKDFYAAGRLDYDSEGLLLLCEDGALQQRITSPLQKTWKRYWLQLEGEISEEAVDALRQGVELRDGPTRPAQASIIQPPPLWPRDPPIRQRARQATSWIEIAIHEGRNRQLRRMTASVGFPVLRLIRVAIGDWELGGLAPGESRILTVHLPRGPSGRPRRRRT